MKNKSRKQKKYIKKNLIKLIYNKITKEKSRKNE